MTIWKEIEGWTFEYFDRDIAPAALPGFEDLVRLWQDRRGDRVVPSWSDFDFYDFKGWHGRLSVYSSRTRSTTPADSRESWSMGCSIEP